jgi:peptidoglycan hydrolase CwlO-like protein
MENIVKLLPIIITFISTGSIAILITLKATKRKANAEAEKLENQVENEKKISELDYLNSKKSAIDLLSGQVDALVEKVASLQSELIEKKGEIEVLTKKNNTLKTEVEELKKEIDQYKKM